MKIGIIGAGHIGAALAKKLVVLGHSVAIANSRGADTLRDVAAATGARAVDAREAVKDVEVVIVTIPQKAIPDLPAGLFREVPASVPVVDTGNYYPTLRDGVIPELESRAMTESAWVAKHLGHPVFKVFNNIMVSSLAERGRPEGAPDRIALAVAGDDPAGKARLFELVDALGFDPIDGGSLAESWRQEPGTPAYCTDLGVDAAKHALAAADRAKSPAARDRAVAFLVQNPGMSTDEVLKHVREITRGGT